MAKILIMDDDPMIVQMYQKILTHEGFEVEIAHNGEEGFEKAKVTHPTLILSDMMMPKMNGLQTLEKLKAEPSTKGIPVVMLTSLMGQQDAETALAKGAVKYIIKSEYEPKQVAEMVKDVLAGYANTPAPQTA